MAVCRVPSPTPASAHNQFLDSYDPQGSQSVRLTRDRLAIYLFIFVLYFHLSMPAFYFHLSMPAF